MVALKKRTRRSTKTGNVLEREIRENQERITATNQELRKVTRLVLKISRQLKNHPESRPSLEGEKDNLLEMITKMNSMFETVIEKDIKLFGGDQGAAFERNEEMHKLRGLFRQTSKSIVLLANMGFLPENWRKITGIK